MNNVINQLQTNTILQLTLDFDPSTTISSVIHVLKEKLQKEYQMESIQAIKMIYRGFILEEQETLLSVFSKFYHNYIVFY